MHTLKVVDDRKTVSHVDPLMTAYNSQNLDEILATAVLMGRIICPQKDMFQFHIHFLAEYYPIILYQSIQWNIVHVVIIFLLFGYCLREEMVHIHLKCFNILSCPIALLIY